MKEEVSDMSANLPDTLPEQSIQFWNQINMESVQFEIPTTELCPVLIPSINRTLEQNARNSFAKVSAKQDKTKILRSIFQQAATTQNRTSGRKRQNFKAQKKNAQEGSVKLKTWREFNSLHEHAKRHGFKITNEEIATKYKKYISQGQIIADVEKQYLIWIQEIEQTSLHLDESTKRERMQHRKQRIKELFTKLRWHLTDRFIPEVLTQTVKRVSRGRRALPKEAVQILKKWLFEHFGNPYPNTIEKQHLAYRTGLTAQQVSYWFINARVRIWKPLVEKYTENNGNVPNSVTQQES